MRKRHHLALAVAAVGATFVLGACGGGGGGGGGASDGKKLFSTSCASCHGPDAKGLPNLGKDLTASKFVDAQTDPALVDFIKKGRATDDPANTTGVAMPPKGGNPALTDEQIASIVAYLRTL
jgi:disulfide bond formation protein DsbB